MKKVKQLEVHNYFFEKNMDELIAERMRNIEITQFSEDKEAAARALARSEELYTEIEKFRYLVVGFYNKHCQTKSLEAVKAALEPLADVESLHTRVCVRRHGVRFGTLIRLFECDFSKSLPQGK